MEETSLQTGRSVSNFVAGIFFVLTIAIVCHLLFSWIGFNPTDDGFTLAYSSRLVDGQVPHRDFISIRPVGSPIMHIPEVLLGGNFTWQLSRFVVCLEFAVAAWCWVLIAGRFVKRRMSLALKVALGIMVFCVSNYLSLKDAWHTTDGYFLVSIGLLLALGENHRRKFLGYFIIGLAYLCKQSFVLVGPLTLLVLADWRKLRLWSALVLPGIVYVGSIVIAGGLTDFMIQMSGHTEILQIGVLSYLGEPFFWAGVMAGSGLLLVRDGVNQRVRKLLNDAFRQYVSLSGVLVMAVFLSLAMMIGLYAGTRVSFVLFGSLSVIAFHGLIMQNDEKNFWKLSFLGLIVSWSISISLGGNFPGRGTGAILMILVLSIIDNTPIPISTKKLPRYVTAGVMGLSLLIIIAGFAVGKLKYPYRDQPAELLTYDLGHVMAGGQYLKTNKQTYEFMSDLHRTTNIFGDNQYCIMPDLASHWVQSRQSNPLPIDWVQGTELCNEKLLGRVIDSLESRRNELIILVQKNPAETIWDVLEPLPINDHYAVVRYVKVNFEKQGETRFFEIYGTPSAMSDISSF